MDLNMEFIAKLKSFLNKDTDNFNSIIFSVCRHAFFFINDIEK